MAYKVLGIETQKIKAFSDLVAWQVGHQVVLDVYELTKAFPKDEKYGLSIQMRRAAVSITSNIAEGFSRRTKKDKNQFYSMTQCSLGELQNQLRVAADVEYVDIKKFENLTAKTQRVQKLINGLMKASASAQNIPDTSYQIPNTRSSP